jgi:hypothetical protein
MTLAGPALALLLLGQVAERVPAELHLAPTLPFPALAQLAALPGVLLVLDTRQAPLTRVRVDLASQLRAAVGARVVAPLSPSLVKLLGRLEPALLVVEVPGGTSLAELADDLGRTPARARRLEVSAVPDAAARSALRGLRPVHLRFPQPSGGLPAGEATALHGWPGGVSVVVDETISPEVLRGGRWPSPVVLHLSPQGNYLADATLAAMASVEAMGTSVALGLPLSAVEVAQLRRLRGPRVEIRITQPPSEEDLAALRALTEGAPFPIGDGGLRAPTRF